MWATSIQTTRVTKNILRSLSQEETHGWYYKSGQDIIVKWNHSPRSKSTANYFVKYVNLIHKFGYVLISINPLINAAFSPHSEKFYVCYTVFNPETHNFLKCLLNTQTQEGLSISQSSTKGSENFIERSNKDKSQWLEKFWWDSGFLLYQVCWSHTVSTIVVAAHDSHSQYSGKDEDEVISTHF